MPCVRPFGTRFAACARGLMRRALAAPFRAPAGRRRRGRIRAGRHAVFGADLCHSGNGDGVLRRSDAGSGHADASRLIMTGQAQTARASAQPTSRRRCARTSPRCSIAPTASMSTSRPIAALPRSTPHRRSVNGQLDTSNMGYNPGGPGDIVVVSLYYQWPIYVSLLGQQPVHSERRQSSADGDVGFPRRAVQMTVMPDSHMTASA